MAIGDVPECLKGTTMDALESVLGQSGKGCLPRPPCHLGMSLNLLMTVVDVLDCTKTQGLSLTLPHCA